ncbi:hypothetical protein I8H84_00830 [Candidatus Saccharibacteria bacterium]|nr:hypothetical protein [Candidatus Saccharibacteria bacterium]MBH1972491.1 hypothetical protein [Candidatus Saccharibacteria bacterium]MBH1990167.1 hypothetical protein [Candidatus Saccharibacteria bacterium]
MARLPQPGGDSGNWGDILNDYLSQAHSPSGQLRAGSVSATNVIDGSLPQAKLDTSTQNLLARAATATQPTDLASKLDQPAVDIRVRAVGDNIYSSKIVIDAEDYKQANDQYDHQRVQRAVNAASALGGGEVLLKLPNYTFRRGINMSGCNNVTIRGAGRTSTQIYVPGNEANAQVDSVFWTNGACSNLTFAGFTIKGTVVDDATGPRRSRTFAPTPGYSQAFTFRGDMIPDSNGATPNTAYPRVENIFIKDVKIDGSRTLPWLFSGVAGTAQGTNCEFRNTMDPGWIFCDRVVATDLTSVLSADNGFSFSRGNKSVIAANLYAINPAYYGLWVAGFLTSDGPTSRGPENFIISNVNIINAGMGGVLLDNAPRNGKITGLFINGVSRGPSDEPDVNGGVGIRFGGYPSDNRVSPSEYASRIEISDFVLINCAKGGVQPTGTQDCVVRNGLIVNPGSEFDHTGTTTIADTDTTQNFGIATAGIAASTVVRFTASDIRVVDDRSTPRANYPVYLEGTTGVEYTGITSHGTRRTAATDSVAVERRLLGSTVIQSMLIVPSGIRSGANAATGTIRGSDVNGAAGSRRQIGQALTAGTARWDVAASGDVESGANAGSNLVVAGYSDAGVKLADYLVIRRTDGRAAFGGAVQLKSYTTATRPTPASVGAGGQIYDSTLGYAITSDGTNWKFGPTVV